MVGSNKGIALHPAKSRSFVQGWPGIPSGPGRPAAHIAGHVQIACTHSRAVWVRVDLRKHESVPGLPPFTEMVGGKPLTIWRAQRQQVPVYGSTTSGVVTTTPVRAETDLKHDQMLKEDDLIPFTIPLPEKLPPSAGRIDKQSGIWYELVATLCIRKRQGLLKKHQWDKDVHLSTSEPIVLDKFDLLPIWPLYNVPERLLASAEEGALQIALSRNQYAYGPGDRIHLRLELGNAGTTRIQPKRIMFALNQKVKFRMPANPSRTSTHGLTLPSDPVRTTEVCSRTFAAGKALDSGETRGYDLSLAVPKQHALMTINSAQRIQIHIRFSVYAYRRPIAMGDLPVTIGTFNRPAAARIAKRIGYVKGWCDDLAKASVPTLNPPAEADQPMRSVSSRREAKEPALKNPVHYVPATASVPSLPIGDSNHQSHHTPASNVSPFLTDSYVLPSLASQATISGVSLWSAARVEREQQSLFNYLSEVCDDEVFNEMAPSASAGPSRPSEQLHFGTGVIPLDHAGEPGPRVPPPRASTMPDPATQSSAWKQGLQLPRFHIPRLYSGSMSRIDTIPQHQTTSDAHDAQVNGSNAGRSATSLLPPPRIQASNDSEPGSLPSHPLQPARWFSAEEEKMQFYLQPCAEAQLNQGMFPKSPVASTPSLVGQSDGLSHSASPSPSSSPSPGATDRSNPKAAFALPGKGKGPSPVRESPNQDDSAGTLDIEPMRPSVELPSYDEVMRSSSSPVDPLVDQGTQPGAEDFSESEDPKPVSLRASAVRRKSQIISDTLSLDPVHRTVVTGRADLSLHASRAPRSVRTPSPLNPSEGRITFEGPSSSNATSVSSGPSIDSFLNLDLSKGILDALPSLSPSSHTLPNWTEWAKPLGASGAPQAKRLPGERDPPKRPMRVLPPIPNSSYLTVPGQATRKRLSLVSTGATELSVHKGDIDGLDQLVEDPEVANEASPYWCSSSAYQAPFPLPLRSNGLTKQLS